MAGLKNGESDGKQKNSSWGVGVTHNAGTDRRLSNFSSSKKTGTFSSFPVRALLPSRQACSGRSRIRPAAPGALVEQNIQQSGESDEGGEGGGSFVRSESDAFVGFEALEDTST